MNIIVCIKQVPETTEVRVNPETNTLIREGVKSIINPFDMYAIEEAVRLKEKLGGKIVVITMGPPQAECALREAISLGIDEAVLICDRAYAGSDTWVTSFTLAAAVKELNEVSGFKYDLIICGKQASDGDTAQVGPGIATHLDIPQVTYVKKVEEIKDNVIRVERMMEEGFEIIEVSLPCLFSVVKEINEPRIPSLKGMMKAKSAKVNVWSQKELNLDAQSIGLCGSPTQVVKIFTPAHREGGQILTGETENIAIKLVELLKNEIN
ncbi:MAG: electron transfer flavoprotein subunit beta/FixA family protein [Candidatus Omnitrophota bacterium]